MVGRVREEETGNAGDKEEKGGMKRWLWALVVIITVLMLLGCGKRTAYEEQCVEVAYDDLVLNPGKYLGRDICTTVKLKYYLDGECDYPGIPWRGNTDRSGYDIYFDPEYLVMDNRNEHEDCMEAGNVVTLYGKFLGNAEMTVGFSRTVEKVPCIDVKYAEGKEISVIPYEEIYSKAADRMETALPEAIDNCKKAEKPSECYQIMRDFTDIADGAILEMAKTFQYGTSDMGEYTEWTGKICDFLAKNLMEISNASEHDLDAAYKELTEHKTQKEIYLLDIAENTLSENVKGLERASVNIIDVGDLTVSGIGVADGRLCSIGLDAETKDDSPFLDSDSVHVWRIDIFEDGESRDLFWVDKIFSEE